MTESLLDQALDQIKRGRTNEGFRAWEALFPKLCEEEGLIYGLAMKIELVEALRRTEHKLAKRTCQEILNQIYENEDKNHLSKDANWDTLSNLAWEIYDMLSGDEVLDPSDASIQVVQDEVQPASPRKLQPMLAWPKMPRNVISTEALREFGLNHEVRNDNVIIFSILTEDEVTDLVLRSIEIRRERSLAQRTHAPVSVGSRPGPSKYLDFSPSQRPQAGNSEAFRDESPAVSEEVLNHLGPGTPLGIKQASQGTGLSRSALDINGVLLTLNSSIQNSDIWLNNFSTTQQRLKSDLGPHPQCGRKIKIAILDTGCNIDDPYFLSNGMDRVEGLKDSWHDMLDESPTPVDLDAGKHGTALAILLLQLAPDAEVHVIRIARDSSQIDSAKAAVEEAIRLAADEKDVDIISMSFGFQKDIGVIQSALTAAEIKKDHKILFFAAANNDGLNDPERYPARSEAVISVRGTDHAGIMVGQYNPGNWEQNPGDQLCTLAKNVPCGFLAPKSGCSVATPILAAIAANIIAFVDCSSHFSEDERAIVRQRRGILQVFREMARFQRPAADRLYVAPWHLYEGSRKPHTVISYALSNLPQRE